MLCEFKWKNFLLQGLRKEKDRIKLEADNVSRALYQLFG